jgi:hypothetical protein
MRLLGTLMVVFALVSPAFAADGVRAAAEARTAARDLQGYLDEMAENGTRPDYAKAPAAGLFRRIFDFDRLAALPPPKAEDLPWLLDWADAASKARQMVMLFGSKPGPGVDATALSHNIADYEGEFAAATDFTVRLEARQTIALGLFIDGLAPEQRTPVRAAGVAKAKAGAAAMIDGFLVSFTHGMNPANARRVTAAMRDTRDVWAAFLAPDARAHAIAMVTRATRRVTDDDMRKDLASFAAALEAAK